eukprot:1515327-Amphidinium_carterae.1
MLGWSSGYSFCLHAGHGMIDASAHERSLCVCVCARVRGWLSSLAPEHRVKKRLKHFGVV